MRMSSTILLIALCVMSTRIEAQEVLFSFTGSAQNGGFGEIIANLGDINGDGKNDLGISAPLENANGQTGAGVLRIYSGASGAILRTHSGTLNYERVGMSLTNVGDLNNDGRAEYAYMTASSGSPVQTVVIKSGSTGSTLFTLLGTTTGDGFGNSISSAGDYNNDGQLDIAIGAPTKDIYAGEVKTGRVYIFSGSSGAQIATIDGDTYTGPGIMNPKPGNRFGYAIASADVNRDNKLDLIIGAPGRNRLINGAWQVNAGEVKVISGAAPHNVLYSAIGDYGSVQADQDDNLNQGNWFGAVVSAAGDFNNDQFPDYVAGSSTSGVQNGGFLRIFSGRTGEAIFAPSGYSINTQAQGFGNSVALMGDYNGDGFQDLVVGAFNHAEAGSSSGAALVISGADGTVIAKKLGTPSSRMGYMVTGMGDLDGDGKTEFAASEKGYLSNTGRVQIFKGQAIASNPSIVLGQRSGSRLAFSGTKTISLGDVNGDSKPDYLVAASGTYPTTPESVSVISGNDHSAIYTITTSTPSDGFGSAIAKISDINADGKSDFVIGVEYGQNASNIYTGKIEFRSGATGALLGTVYGDTASAFNRFGSALGTVADLNNDGAVDLIVGAQDWSNQKGQVKVVSGKAPFSVLFTIAGTVSADKLGFAVTGLGDLNGDGKPEFAAGAPRPGSTTTAGKVIVYSGANASVLMTINGSGLLDEFGSSISLTGDQNGDGKTDILIGAPKNSAGGVDAGRAYLYSGSIVSGGTLLTTITGETGSLFGSSVLGDTDINLDGKTDFLITAPNRSSGSGYDVGAVYIYRGSATTPPMLSLIQGYGRNGFGSSVATIADLSGDNKPDIIVGSKTENLSDASTGGVRVYESLPPVGCGVQILGTGDVLTTGGTATITTTGTPSLATQGFSIQAHGPVWGRSGLFSSATPAAIPMNGLIWNVGNPSTIQVINLDGNGNGSINIPVTSQLVGTTKYYQLKFRNGAAGLGITNAIAVTFCQ